MKFLKYTALGLGLFLAAAIGFFFYSIYKLPDPIVIKETLKGEEAESFIPQNEIQKEVSQEIEALAETIQEEPIPQSQGNEENENQDLAVFKIIEEEYEDIRVCENLGNKSLNELNLETLKKAVDSTDRDDPVIESMRVPLKHIFQSKPVKELIAEIDSIEDKDLKGEEKTSYLKKIGFYTKAANKVREIYSRKEEYEEIGDRGYHLYVITQLVTKKPELARDRNLLDFCDQLETSVANRSKTNIEEERSELLKLIEYAGMTPEQLNFNPKIRTKFHVNLNNKGITFGFDYPGSKVQ